SVCKQGAKCCGYPLYAAGANEAFEAHAHKFAASLAAYPEVVILDPGCAYTLKVVYPRFGVNPTSRILTVYEVLAQRLEHAPELPRLEESVAYQDACHLGRGLGQYDPPRALLHAAATGFKEANETKAHAGCSGGGGLLPRTSLETTVEVSRRQAERVAPGGETIVTACPTSRRMFERAGRKSEDLITFVRRWLDAGKGAGQP
ncbi:MAG: (Fe-S)-binding protein, partial [Myxococcaceae bacterium]